MAEETRGQIFERLRAEYLSHDNVARAAYEEWERDGRPDGNQPWFRSESMTVAELHWLRAQMILEALADCDADFIYYARPYTPDAHKPDDTPLVPPDQGFIGKPYALEHTETAASPGGLVQPSVPLQLEFYAYQTAGVAVYDEFGMSAVPGWLDWLRNWRPFLEMRKPLMRVGLLREHNTPGEFSYEPKRLAAFVHWNPTSRLAYRLWVRMGKPGLLGKLDFKF